LVRQFVSYPMDDVDLFEAVRYVERNPVAGSLEEGDD